MRISDWSSDVCSSDLANVSDADIQKFAKAAVELEQIKADTAVPEESKQPLMLAAVKKQGLDPEKFNSIAQAAQADPTLQQKIPADATSQPAGTATPPRSTHTTAQRDTTRPL